MSDKIANHTVSENTAVDWCRSALHEVMDHKKLELEGAIAVAGLAVVIPSLRKALLSNPIELAARAHLAGTGSIDEAAAGLAERWCPQQQFLNRMDKMEQWVARHKHPLERDIDIMPAYLKHASARHAEAVQRLELMLAHEREERAAYPQQIKFLIELRAEALRVQDQFANSLKARLEASMRNV